MRARHKKNLKPCPHCGASFRFLSCEGGYVLCNRCRSAGPDVDPNNAAKKSGVPDRVVKMLARQAWNMRVEGERVDIQLIEEGKNGQENQEEVGQGA